MYGYCYINIYITWVITLFTRFPYNLGCSVGTQRILSYDTDLLPPTNINASSQDQSFNPDDYLFHRNNVPLRLWCSQAFNIPSDEESREGFNRSLLDFEHNNSGYLINVTFSQPILITQIISSGFSNGFVNNFSITYASEDDEGLLTLLDEQNEVSINFKYIIAIVLP